MECVLFVHLVPEVMNLDETSQIATVVFVGNRIRIVLNATLFLVIPSRRE